MVGLFPGSEASLFKTSGFGAGLGKVVKKSLAYRAKETSSSAGFFPTACRGLRETRFVPITELAKRLASRCHLVVGTQEPRSRTRRVVWRKTSLILVNCVRLKRGNTASRVYGLSKIENSSGIPAVQVLKNPGTT